MVYVKIYGAGSIGNHLAYACRSKGWNVLICDVDTEALEHTKNEIYPSRYGSWDDEISLIAEAELEEHKYDLVIIGTPPAQKQSRIQGSKGFVEWHVNWDSNNDAVVYGEQGEASKQNK